MQVSIAHQLGLQPTTVGNFFMNARRRLQDKWKESDHDVAANASNEDNTTEDEEAKQEDNERDEDDTLAAGSNHFQLPGPAELTQEFSNAHLHQQVVDSLMSAAPDDQIVPGTHSQMMAQADTSSDSHVMQPNSLNHHEHHHQQMHQHHQIHHHHNPHHHHYNPHHQFGQHQNYSLTSL